MRYDNLAAWLHWLEQCHPSEIDLGLARIASVASFLPLDFSKTAIVTVAGTNGKGSTVAILSAILQHASSVRKKPFSGEDATALSMPANPANVINKTTRVGVYTSPHLRHFSERIVVNNECVSEATLCVAFDRVDQALAKQVAADRLNDLPETTLTYFEFTTLAALLIFAKANLDVIVLEVGLGGRLDAVNIIDADIAIITSIAVDHEAWLGNDRETIAVEKAGIMRKKGISIIADPNPPNSLVQQVADLQCHAYYLHQDFGFNREGRFIECFGRTGQGSLYDYRFEPSNYLHPASWSAALQAAALLVELPVQLEAVSSTITLEGRLSTKYFKGHELLLDVAHNPHSVQGLQKHLLQQREQADCIFIFAAMADKAIADMLLLLSPLAKCWFFVDLPGVSRAMSAESLDQHYQQLLQREHLPKSPAKCCDNVASALNEATQIASQSDRIVICGSFYTIAEALDVIESDV